MSAMIFDGEQFARDREFALKSRVLALGRRLTLGVLLFSEDEAGRVYVNKKRELAERLGIGFVLVERGMGERVENLVAVVRELSEIPEIDGVMVQKPSQRSWISVRDARCEMRDFWGWWEEITLGIDPKKDVDCLTRTNLEAVYDGSWKEKGVVLPATVRGVVEMLGSSLQLVGGRGQEKGKINQINEMSKRSEMHKTIENNEMSKKSEITEISKKIEINERTSEFDSTATCIRVAVVGRSELVGRPLAYVLAQQGYQVALCGSAGLDEAERHLLRGWELSGTTLSEVVREARVVISATGKRGLITGEIVAEGAVVIDVGFPGADVDFESVSQKAAFITPVPGGVGPVTVMSLMENLVEIGEQRTSRFKIHDL